MTQIEPQDLLKQFDEMFGEGDLGTFIARAAVETAVKYYETYGAGELNPDLVIGYVFTDFPLAELNLWNWRNAIFEKYRVKESAA